jgi:glutathione synthase/RimK-type ligase-like ATP-grasp enzyme
MSEESVIEYIRWRHYVEVMKPYLWSTRTTSPTRRALAELLDIDNGMHSPRRENKVVIVWGAKPDRSLDYSRHKWINTIDSVNRNRHKFNSLHIMEEHGVSVPRSFDSYEHDIYDRLLNECRAIIGRRNYHQGGTEFHVCLSRMDIDRAKSEGADYFVKYIPKKNEFRFHVMNGKVIRVSQKVRKTELEEGETFDSQCWSHNKGWRFRGLRLDNPLITESAKENAIKSLEALGMDFGAVDLVEDEDGNPFVLEINSAPGLEGTTLDIYVRELRKLIMEKYPMVIE